MTRSHGRSVAVVRRGETEVFQTLQDRLAELQLAEVIWDRRVGDRRTPPSALAVPERRRRDRRTPAPVTWGPLGFVLAIFHTL